MMGLKGATSHYTCVWCKVHKDHRWDTSFPSHHYESSNLKRTIKEISELAKKKGKQNYCCKHTPLVKIELDRVIVDELDLLLRILDVLIENLIRDALDCDQKENKRKKKANKKIPTLQIYKHPFDHVVSPLTYGRKLMLMGNDLANMISLVFWTQTKRNC